jgi:sulfhydrogenase subunit gamma (sulfur reductase)
VKRGIGICVSRNVGPKYVDLDGPVFSLAKRKELPDKL